MTDPVDPQDTRFMERALALARQGVGLASPNPTVGAVLVKDGSIVGEGSHRYNDRDHAEIVALEAAGAAARGATLYINLEPCCHTGRTGPCTEAIIRAGVSRVVAAMQDPNPEISGSGLAKLRAAGVEVELGPRAADAKRLNESFARWIRSKRPLVTMKVALTLDGRIASPKLRGRAASGRLWITSEESRAEVQRMRHAADAVLTGVGTVLADDPLLTDRTGLPRRRPLLRVVLDSRLRLPRKSNLIKTCQGDVLVMTAASPNSPRGRALRKAGVEVLRVPRKGKRTDLRAVIAALGERQILNLMIEGGSELNGAALASGIVDKLVLFYAPKLLGCDGLPFADAWGKTLASLPPLGELSLQRFGPDIMVEGYLRDVYRDH